MSGPKLGGGGGGGRGWLGGRGCSIFDTGVTLDKGCESQRFV